MQMLIGPAAIVPKETKLPDLLGDNGIIKLLPSGTYEKMSNNKLRVWCHNNARYGIPTIELIAVLRREIGKRSVLEIGAGHGDLSYHLGIRATDNYSQTFEDVVRYYTLMGQPLIQYPKALVEKMDAARAIKKYRPEVVIASWVTEWIDPRLPPPPQGGSVYGIKEDEIIESGVTYILMGNTTVHGNKKIMARPHREIEGSYLVSRSGAQDQNRIWIWNG